MRRNAGLVALAVVLLAEGARAQCCRIVKIDAETPPAIVRVCEVGPQRSCGAVLFYGTFELGTDRNVCAAGSTIVYQELDPVGGVFGPSVEARCDGGDVEL